MNYLKIIVADENSRLEKLSKKLESSGIRIIKCKQELFRIYSEITKQLPSAVILTNKLFGETLSTHFLPSSSPPDIFIYPFDMQIDAEKEANKILEKVYGNYKLISKQRYMRQNAADELINECFGELGFTVNYCGTIYIRTILEAICHGDLSISDSMSKVMIPYTAKTLNVEISSVSHGIRHAIKKCWPNSMPGAHEKYFGLVFSDKSNIPTSREFIMILADYLLRQLKNQLY